MHTVPLLAAVFKIFAAISIYKGIFYLYNTISWQEHTRLTVRLSGAFCPFRLDGLRHICDSKAKNHSKIHHCQVQAVLPEQKSVQAMKSPQAILCVLARALKRHGRFSARQNRVCPCQLMVMTFANTSYTHATLSQNIFLISRQFSNRSRSSRPRARGSLCGASKASGACRHR